jgi:DnaK suppressor protein
LALSLIGQKEQRQRILSALERIESGEYGICEECGDPIAEARLKAAPWAATCISCQQEIETAEAEQRRAKRGMD